MIVLVREEHFCRLESFLLCSWCLVFGVHRQTSHKEQNTYFTIAFSVAHHATPHEQDAEDDELLLP